MEKNYKSNGAFIDDLEKALVETKPDSPYGWYHRIEIDSMGLVNYVLGSTAADFQLKSTCHLGHLLPADYAYTKRGVAYHWHKYKMDLWHAGILPERPPVFDCDAAFETE